MDTKIVQFLSSLRFTNKKKLRMMPQVRLKIEARIGNETSALVYIRHGRDLLYRGKKVIVHVVIVFSNKVGFFVIVHLNWCYVILFRVAIGIRDKSPFDYAELHM